MDGKCANCVFGVPGIKKDLFFTPTKKLQDNDFARIQCRRFPTFEMHKPDEGCGEYKKG